MSEFSFYRLLRTADPADASTSGGTPTETPAADQVEAPPTTAADTVTDSSGNASDGGSEEKPFPADSVVSGDSDEQQQLDNPSA